MQSSVATIILLLGVIIAVLSQEVEPEQKKNLLNNCFFEDKKNTCQSKAIKIGEDYYGCDSQVPFDYEIRRIGFVGEPEYQVIQVEDSNENAFIFDDITGTKNATDGEKLQTCIIITDDLENSYNLEGGKAFVKSKNGIERSITLDEDFVPVELFKDPTTNQLLILATKENSSGVKEGVVCAIPLITSRKDSGKTNPINAQIISPSNVIITALSIYEGLDELILAVKGKGFFKVVKVYKLEEDPCKNEPVEKSLREKILEIVVDTHAEMVEKIAQECEISALSSNRKNEVADGNEEQISIDTRRRLRRYIDNIASKLAAAEVAPNDFQISDMIETIEKMDDLLKE